MTEVKRGRPAKRPDPDNRTNRARRSSVNSGKDRLSVSGNLDKNYHYHIANDEGSRIEELKSYGYEIAPDQNIGFQTKNKIESGSAHSVVVDRRTGKKGVLMRQPIEFHEEDKKAKAELIAEREKSMFRELKQEDGRYGGVENTSSLARSVDD
ncbi:MAG: hypothetical protein KJO69_04985 [Gammaproteobacteria bacterium]|nr:hypothetical protein [Gammaproteobacteria bacterium]